MFLHPKENIDYFNIEQGMKVADIGAGSGHFALLAATKVGEMGKIYAIDIQKSLLEKIKRNAQAQHLTNIEVIWGNAEKINGTHLKDGLIDRAIISNVLFQIEDKETFCEEIKRIIKPNGKVFLIDWTDSFGGIGPHGDHVFVAYQARELFERHGFVSEKDFVAGEHHYGMVFKKV